MMAGLMDFRPRVAGLGSALQEPRGLGAPSSRDIAAVGPAMLMSRAQRPAAFAYADPKLGARRLQAVAERAAANFLLKGGIAEDAQEALKLARRPEVMSLVLQGVGYPERDAAAQHHRPDPAATREGTATVATDSLSELPMANGQSRLSAPEDYDSSFRPATSAIRAADPVTANAKGVPAAIPDPYSGVAESEKVSPEINAEMAQGTDPAYRENSKGLADKRHDIAVNQYFRFNPADGTISEISDEEPGRSSMPAHALRQQAANELQRQHVHSDPVPEQGASDAAPMSDYDRSYFAQGTSGINEGIGTSLGAPVDLANAALGLGMAGVNRLFGTEYKPSERPFLGSRQINGWMEELGSIKPKTDDPGTQVVRRIGNSIGSNIVPGGYALRTAGQPLRVGASLLGTTITGGIGAATAQQLFPDNPYAEMVGEFLSSLGGAGLVELGRKALSRNAGPTAVAMIGENASKLAGSSKKGRVTAPGTKAEEPRGSAPDAMPARQDPATGGLKADDFVSPTEPAPHSDKVRPPEAFREAAAGDAADVDGSGPDASKLFPEGGRRQVEQRDLERHVSSKVSPRMAALIVNKDVRDGLKRVIEDGLKKGAKFWYDTEPLYKAFINELGEEEGEVAFEQFINLFAATSPASNVPQSIRTGSYYYSRLRRGRRAPKVGKEIPTPFGHRVQKKHQAFVREYLAEMKWPTKDKPKIASMAEALRGNHSVVPVDRHAFRLVAMLSKDTRFLRTRFRRRGSSGPRINVRKMVQSNKMSMDEALSDPAYWLRAPNKYEYAEVEKLYKEIASELGLTPAEAQAAAWVGGAELTGLRTDPMKNFMQHLEERIMITAAKKKLDPRLVLKQFIRGEKPLLGLGAVLLGGAYLEDRKPGSAKPGAQ